MPCNTVQITNVDIGKVDPKLLVLALSTLGLNPRMQSDVIYFQNGVYSINEKSMDLRGLDVDERVAAMKRAYSGEVVKSTAKKYGWQLKTLGENKYQVIKRSI